MAAPGFVIAATGLKAEARIAAQLDRVTPVAGGGDETRLAALIEGAIVDGVRGLVSFGIAGALSPELKSGTCIVGTSVVCGDEWHAAEAAWRDRIARRLPGVRLGQVVGCGTAVAEPAAKAALFKATGALAADMESHVVARIAGQHGLPFAVLRVIADPSHRRVPPAALCGLKPDGTTDPVAVLKSLGRAPGQIGDLVFVAIGAQRAMHELLRCHRLLGAGFSFGDLG